MDLVNNARMLTICEVYVYVKLPNKIEGNIFGYKWEIEGWFIYLAESCLWVKYWWMTKYKYKEDKKYLHFHI